MKSLEAEYVGDTINLSRTAVPTEFVVRATAIIQPNRDLSNINYNSVGTTMYFNVRSKLSDRAVHGHECVTEERIKVYEAGLNGGGEDVTDYDERAKPYTQLYKVEKKGGTVECECKDYWHSLVCPHVLVHENVHGKSAFLSVSLSEVPKVRLRKSRKITASRHLSARSQKASKEAVRSQVCVCVYACVCVYERVHIYAFCMHVCMVTECVGVVTATVTVKVMVTVRVAATVAATVYACVCLYVYVCMCMCMCAGST